MKFNFANLRFVGVFALIVVIAGLTVTAEATVHPLTGNLRFQTGNRLPIPIGFPPLQPVGSSQFRMRTFLRPAKWTRRAFCSWVVS